MKYTKQQKALIKELLNSSNNYIEQPLFNEEHPYYNTNLARKYLYRYRDAKTNLKQSNALTKLYQQDISRIDDSELQNLLTKYKKEELASQKEYIAIQQEVISTINKVPDARYKLLLTNYYLNDIPLVQIASNWEQSYTQNRGCTFRAIKYIHVEALKQVCEVLHGDHNGQ